MKARGEIPIIIFCAEDDEPVLAKVVDELHREGLAPELVPGIELDTSLLAAHVDSAGADALFVLCSSATLDKNMVRRLTGLFSARSGSGQRIISTALNPSRPLAVLPAIRGALKELRRGEDPREEAAESNTSHLRDVVEAFAEPAPPRRAAPSRADAPVERSSSRPSSRSSGPAIVDPRTEGATARSEPARNIPVESQPAAIEASRAALASSAGPGQPFRPPIAVVANVDASPQAAVNDDVVRSIEQRLAGVPSMPDSFVSTDPSTSSPRIPRTARAADSSGRAPVFDEPRGNRMLLIFAGVGIAGILALALMQVLQPTPSENHGKVPVRSTAPAPAESPTPPTPAESPAPAPTPPVVVPTPEPRVVPPAVDAVTAIAEVVPPEDPEPTAPAPVAAPAPSTDTPPAPSSTVSRRDLDLAALELARSEGKINRAGKLWITHASSDENTWDEAQRRCHGKRINGVQGFRLPGVRELRKIRAATLVSAGTYWSRDKRADDEAIALDAGSGATNVYLTVEPAGRTVCVRAI